MPIRSQTSDGPIVAFSAGELQMTLGQLEHIARRLEQQLGEPACAEQARELYQMAEHVYDAFLGNAFPGSGELPQTLDNTFYNGGFLYEDEYAVLVQLGDRYDAFLASPCGTLVTASPTAGQASDGPRVIAAGHEDGSLPVRFEQTDISAGTKLVLGVTFVGALLWGVAAFFSKRR